MRRIAIVGFDENTGRHVPQGPDWEVWLANCVPSWFGASGFRYDLAFQLHERFSLSDPEVAFLQTCRSPLVTFWPWEEIAQGIEQRTYPLAWVEAMKGVLPGGFFACSFAYMTALAVWENLVAMKWLVASETPGNAVEREMRRKMVRQVVSEIGFYGVDLPEGSARERTVEWASVLWWAGYAAGQGITVTAPEGSKLFHYPARYGYQYAAEVADVNARIWDLVKVLNLEYQEGKECWAQPEEVKIELTREAWEERQRQSSLGL